MQVGTLDSVTCVQPEFDFEQQVARGSPRSAGFALSGQSDDLPGAYSPGNPDVERPAGERQVAARVDLRDAQGNLPDGTEEAVLQVEQDLGVVIPGMRVEAPLGAKTARFAADVPEHPGEKVAEPGQVLCREAAAGKLEAGVPVRWGLEFLAGAIGLSKLVVRGPFLGVGEDRMGLVHLLHPLFGIRFFRNVRMIFAGQSAKRFFDLVATGLARDAENLVIVLELHADPFPRQGVQVCNGRTTLSR